MVLRYLSPSTRRIRAPRFPPRENSAFLKAFLGRLQALRAVAKGEKRASLGAGRRLFAGRFGEDGSRGALGRGRIGHANSVGQTIG